ncbi:LysR family transcriptional regulator [Novosphingobium taihuense]|nr:LysR family transcriptional regulator [Novosphingobium taihuense]TWH85163.1 DNA-binding transcriptional LysR family regulator [Novosphingobium taihuense]
MEMHQVRYFLAAARLLNFTRAAIECNVSQPSLTKAILKLEDEFGGPLFRRERARTHLTELGKAMLPHLQRTYDAAQAARQLARDMARAEVAPLSIGISHLVPDDDLVMVLRDLSERLSGIEIEIESGPEPQLVEAAVAGKLDVVIISLGAIPPERFDHWALYEDSFCIALAQDHSFARRDSIAPSEIEAETWIDFAGDGCAALAAFAGRHGAAISVRHHARNPGMVRQLVLAGLGCGWLPRGILPDPLVASPIRVPGCEISFVAAAVVGRRRSIGSDAFLRSCRARDWDRAPSGPNG